jgi:hypothetical protein
VAQVFSRGSKLKGLRRVYTTMSFFRQICQRVLGHPQCNRRPTSQGVIGFTINPCQECYLCCIYFPLADRYDMDIYVLHAGCRGFITDVLGCSRGFLQRNAFVNGLDTVSYDRCFMCSISGWLVGVCDDCKDVHTKEARKLSHIGLLCGQWRLPAEMWAEIMWRVALLS